MILPRVGPQSTLENCIFKILRGTESSTSQDVGTGFFVGDDGYALNCYHVLRAVDESAVRRPQDKVLVRGRDGRQGVALIEFAKSNPAQDIAVLKVAGIKAVRLASAPNTRPVMPYLHWVFRKAGCSPIPWVSTEEFTPGRRGFGLTLHRQGRNFCILSSTQPDFGSAWVCSYP